MSTISIKYASEADRDRLTEFRIAQFSNAKEFELINSHYLSYQRGKILIIEKDGEIISTMQVEKFSSYETIAENSPSICPESFDLFPTFYLSKGATSKEFRNSGLNSILRKLTLELAFTDKSICSLTGFLFENAPRIRLLEKLGYSFTETTLVNEDNTKPYGKVFFLTLHKDSFKSAYDLLTKDVDEISKLYSIIYMI